MSDEGILEFREAPESTLMHSNRRGRPRDTRFDDAVRVAYETSVAQSTVVSEDYVPELVKGIRNAAKHFGYSVSCLAFDPDDEGKVRVEFIVYQTQRRTKKDEKSAVQN